MLEEVLKGGGGGGDTKEAAGLRTMGSLDSGAADSRAVEGSVYPGNNVLGVVGLSLNPVSWEAQRSVRLSSPPGGGAASS